MEQTSELCRTYGDQYSFLGYTSHRLKAIVNRRYIRYKWSAIREDEENGRQEYENAMKAMILCALLIPNLVLRKGWKLNIISLQKQTLKVRVFRLLSLGRERATRSLFNKVLLISLSGVDGYPPHYICSWRAPAQSNQSARVDAFPCAIRCFALECRRSRCPTLLRNYVCSLTFQGNVGAMVHVVIFMVFLH